jgi:hypothetical protein
MNRHRVICLKERSFEEENRILTQLLNSTRPEDLSRLLAEHADAFLTGQHPFADYIRMKFREKGLLQQEVFLAADLSENYGYKLISEEKHTRNRDTILRLCFAAHFHPEEIQEALVLYGMAPLYSRFLRDAVLLAASYNSIFDIPEINRLLREHGQTPLLHGYD